jgi:ketosteroid isomerase-like protein
MPGVRARMALWLSLSPLWGQASDPDFARLSQEWMDALWDKDDAALGRLMADDFVLVQVGGPVKTMGRDQWVRMMRLAGKGECSYRNLQVRNYGDLVVVAAEMNCRGDVSNIGIEADSIVTDLWVRRDGTWKVSARYVSWRPSFIGWWGPVAAGAAAPAALWLFLALRRRSRQRGSLLDAARRY